MKQKSSLGRALRTIASFVDSLSDAEIIQLVGGKAKLALVPVERESPMGETPTENHMALMTRIKECADREQARAILSELPNRDALAAFAKSQNLHVAKHDRREDIENKIIEFVVGARLRSEAIRSLNMRGGNDQSGGN